MIGNAIITFLIGAMSFVGQQWGKDKEWQRQQAEKVHQERVDMMRELCKDKNICDPEVKYLTPDVIGPPEPVKAGDK